MNNVIPFNPGQPGRRKKLEMAAHNLIAECEGSGAAFNVFKKKFLKDISSEERFAIGMALFHEGMHQVIRSREDSMDGFSDEDIRCLVSIVVDSILSSEMEVQ